MLLKNRSCSQSDREQLPASSRLRQQRNHIASISPWCLTLGVASLQAASAFTSWIVSRSSALTSFISCFNSSFFVGFFFTHGKCETTRNQPDRQPCVYIYIYLFSPPNDFKVQIQAPPTGRLQTRSRLFAAGGVRSCPCRHGSASPTG